MRFRFAVAIMAMALVVGYVVGENGDYDYLDIVGPGGEIARPNYTEYSPAFADFMREDYLADNESPDTLQIDYTNYTPAFAEFMDPRWEPPPINYSQFSPAFEEFMDPNWRTQPINYSQSTPAFEEFMDPNWIPQPPSLDDYPKWIIDFLGY